MNYREEIIKLTEKLFLSLGIKSVSMDDISREMGISKKTLYQFFNNKDELVHSVIQTHVEREQHQIDQIIQSSNDALEEMNKVGSFVLEMIEDVSPAALYDLQKYYRRSWQYLMKQQDSHIFNCIVQNIHKGIRQGLYRTGVNPEIVARIYVKTSYFVVDEIADHRSPFTRRELITELYDYHIHGIATTKGLAIWKKYRDGRIEEKVRKV